MALNPETCWNYSRKGRRGSKGEWWRGWIQLWYILRTFVNVTLHLQYNNNMIIKKENNFLLAWHSAPLP
jgi:hypothetical protein